MKIGIEGQRLFREKKHGMDMVALELIRNLQRLDTENEYVIFIKPDMDNACLQESENFKIVELKGSFYPYWEQVKLPKAVKAEGCDILHCTSNTAPVNINIPMAVTIHDIIYLEGLKLSKAGGSLYQRLGNMYRKWNVPRVAKNARKIITVSNSEKKRIDQHFGYEKDKVDVVYNGVSEHFKKIDSQKELSEIRKKYDLPEKFIFFLGNTDPKKNTRNVLRAFDHYLSKNQAIPLVMLDFGEENLKDILKEIGKPHLRKHIHLTGYIINSDLPAIYNLSEVFLYPSLRESFGIPMLEAMACGTPVITSNTSSMPEIADDAAYIVDPSKPESISLGIYRLLNNHSLRNKNIQKGFKRASEFSWRDTAEKTLKIYKSLKR
ncbi:MAG: glycosyltransferase family 4 protein [Bacteroidales bacterium]|nr:glycosyltransferase family 4 protein [Bacteroidales bacterium]MCF8326948.1 glycosyltransferase family 4 protein [Bacteroidales bacterium]